MYLLDSNIVIGLFRHDASIEAFLFPLPEDTFVVSVITRLEVLLGAEHENMTLEECELYLDKFRTFDVDKTVVREAVLLQKQNQKKLAFKDLIIAATAKCHRLTLITADRDFNRFEGVKTIFYTP